MNFQGISLFRGKNPLFGRVIALSVAFALALSVAGASAAAFDGRKDKRDAVEECDVKNFGRVNNYIFRGGQPKDDEYGELASLGIKTVLDLREDPEKYARQAAESAGLQYINIRLNARRPPTLTESNHFLHLVNDQKNWPVFVHCAGGRHRTGVLIAIYRMEMDGWDARRAYSEMKDFKFYSRFGYGDMKDYVFDYFDRLAVNRTTQPANSLRPRQAAGAGQDN